jgi:hypothetical protein
VIVKVADRSVLFYIIIKLSVIAKPPNPQWPEMRDSQRNVLRAQKFAKFWSVSKIQPDIKGNSSELRS